MVFETRYKSDFYKLEVDQDAGMLRATWLRPVSSEEMVTGGTKLYEIMCQTKVEKIVANGQALGTLPPEAKNWMATTLYELLSKTHLRMLARIMPETVYHRIALESVVTRAEALGLIKFMVRNFSSENEALWWLKTGTTEMFTTSGDRL